MKHLISTLLLATASLSAFAAGPDPKMDAFIDDLMGKMTLEEKLGQLNLPVSGILTGSQVSENVSENIRKGRTGGVFGVKGADNCRALQDIAVKQSRLGIPLLFGLDVIHGYETTFPIPLAQASSWDMDLIRRSSAAAASECSAAGINWVYSPCLDVSREPRFGRVAEGVGEDPYLGGRIGVAMIDGYQGRDLRDPRTVMACVKHFAMYGAVEAGRDYNTVDMSRQAAMNFYLPPFKMAADAGAGSFMASFNVFEYIPATANRWLLTDVLRKRWGYDGFVVSDYTGVSEMVNHGVGDYADAGAKALEAGVDMDMVSESFLNTFTDAIAKGRVDMKDVDRACRYVLEAKYKLGLFDDPYRYCDAKRAKSDIYNKANRDLAREMAAASMVLLKNEDNLLPLEGNGKIALIGPLANSASNMDGNWSVPQYELRKSVTLLDGLRAAGKKVVYAKGCNALDDAELEAKLTGYQIPDRDPRSEEELNAEALAVAKDADIIVAALGELQEMSGEGASRADIRIPAPQRRLLDKLAATGKPVVIVLFTGRPLVLTEDAPKAKAILNAWFAGSEAGDAIADVLTGKVNPSGKLPMTFPYHLGQVPIYYNHLNTGRPNGIGNPYVKYRSNYQDIPNEPLYPFGYGLSYTTFDYSDVRLSANTMAADGSVTASVTVTNTGKRDGAEVVELYVRDMVGESSRPVKELKGFEKIELKAGESKDVSFKITPDMLSYYNHELDFVLEPGDFEIMIGSASNNVKAAPLTVK